MEEEQTVALTRRSDDDSPQIAVLLLEDDDAEAQRITTALRQPPFGYLVSCERVRTLSGALVALEMKPYRCVLADLKVPDAEGVPIVRMLAERSPETAIVALTRFDKDPLIGELLRAGARQYLVKGFYQIHTSLVVIAHAMERNLRSGSVAASALATYHQASRDALTGLFGRELMQDIGRYAVALASRAHGQLALCSITLDGLSRAEERLGRAAVDAVRRRFAQLLRECVRDEDALARQQGDDYSMLLGPMILGSEAERIANRVIDGVRELRFEQDGELRLSASVGIARFPQDADGYEQLQLNAELAALSARRAGGEQVSFYSLNLRGGRA